MEQEQRLEARSAGVNQWTKRRAVGGAQFGVGATGPRASIHGRAEQRPEAERLNQRRRTAKEAGAVGCRRRRIPGQPPCSLPLSPLFPHLFSSLFPFPRCRGPGRCIGVRFPPRAPLLSLPAHVFSPVRQHGFSRARVRLARVASSRHLSDASAGLAMPYTRRPW